MSGEVEELLAMAAGWARERADVIAVALVGSWARDAASDDSDVDQLILATDPSLYLDADDWATGLGIEAFVETESWGAVTSRRARTASGVEVEIGITTPAWASLDPLVPGTERVVRDGMRIVYDRDGVLGALVRAAR